MIKIACSIVVAAAVTLISLPLATPAHAGCSTEFKVTINNNGSAERQLTRTCDQPAVLMRPAMVMRPVLVQQNCKMTFTTTVTNGQLTRQATRSCG